jgi:uncharacterized LabA/DUF88 family protein
MGSPHRGPFCCLRGEVDKAAVFVDAGYLLAASAELITGSKSRAGIVVDYAPLVQSLIDLGGRHSGGLQFLRLYWYDGARDGTPTREHLEVAHLPQVKLRLGRRTYWGQKGVDSLIVLDLLSLARERAMSTAYLVSGDEDIREGVAAAQQMGVRVVLLGVESRRKGKKGAPRQADTLVREADECVMLDTKLVIEAHIKAAPVPPVMTAVPVMSGTPATTAPPAMAAVSPRAVGHKFGEDWLTKATASEAVALRKQVPNVPPDLDAQLLRDAEPTLGALRGRMAERKELRAGFWDAIMKRAAVTATPAPSLAAGATAAPAPAATAAPKPLAKTPAKQASTKAP